MKRIINDTPQWVQDLNKQESKELQYFQTIQVQKQEIASLRTELGKANAEIEHLTHLLKQQVTEEMIQRYAIPKKSLKSKYCRLMNEHILLQKLKPCPDKPDSDTGESC